MAIISVIIVYCAVATGITNLCRKGVKPVQVAISEFLKSPNRYFEILEQMSVTITKSGRPIAVLAKPGSEADTQILCPKALKQMIPHKNSIKPKRTILEMLGDEYICEDEMDWGKPAGDEVW